VDVNVRLVEGRERERKVSWRKRKGKVWYLQQEFIYPGWWLVSAGKWDDSVGMARCIRDGSLQPRLDLQIGTIYASIAASSGKSSCRNSAFASLPADRAVANP